MNSVLRNQVLKELDSITHWWLDNAIDEEDGGFYGEIDYHGEIVAGANKGIILNSRILWFFSERLLFDDGSAPDGHVRRAAERAYTYLVERFDDRQHGGVFWELAADGALINGKKQVYALCFSIYALVTYYRATDQEAALEKAIEYFEAIEEHALDSVYGGYFEAFSREWNELDDVRLSDIDLNAPKSMNTHLHLLEAYTALHRAAPSGKTQASLTYVINLFLDRIIDTGSGHQRLFFDREWNAITPQISYGHDIETSWLLWEAAEVLDDPAMLARVRPLIEKMADACERKAISEAGHVYDGFDPTTGETHGQGMWWVQCEALVGFLNAHKLTGEARYQETFERVWRHINEHHVDRRAGEWHWLSMAPREDIESEYKVGFWKSPYHNGRAMMEVIRLLDALEES